MNNIIHKIRQIYPVSEEALQALLMNMQVRHYPKGTYIVQAGVTDRLVYFIEEGVTRSVFHHDGQDTTTWFSQEGDVTFGMDSLYYQQPSVESIETLSDCKIYVIHIDKLNALYETYIDIASPFRLCFLVPFFFCVVSMSFVSFALTLYSFSLLFRTAKSTSST